MLVVITFLFYLIFCIQIYQIVLPGYALRPSSRMWSILYLQLLRQLIFVNSVIDRGNHRIGETVKVRITESSSATLKGIAI